MFECLIYYSLFLESVSRRIYIKLKFIIVNFR